MKIALGCDHNGVELKKVLIILLKELGYAYDDFGCYDNNSVDYPDIAQNVAKVVSEGSYQQGLLICGTGIGMSIAANKVSGIRAALCQDVLSAQRAREHNDANILCIGATVITEEEARNILGAYLAASFKGGRHERRVNKIEFNKPKTERQ
jgi:ribose 5-phosphate isomerase B